MGVGWRRFSERVKEKTGGGKKNIPATSNKRNLAMLEELAVFSTQLKHQEKDLRAMKLAVETALKTTRQTMAYPLPRVYYEDEDTANDSVTKQSPIVPISDSCVTHDFSALTLEAGSKLGADTFTPVVRWQTTYEMLQAKNRDVQNLRLEVDSRRRTVKQLAAKLEVVRGKAYANSKHATEADKLAMKLQHKEGKLLVTEERYRQEEEELHRKLVVLCQQAALLRNFTSAALRIESELLMEAAEAVGQIDPALVPPTPTSPYTSVFAASAAARPLSTSAGSAVVVPVTVPEDSVLEGEDLEGTPAGLVPPPAASEHSARLESQGSLQEGSVPASPTAAAAAVVAGGDAVTPQKSITNPVYDHENGQMVPPTPSPANGATAAAGTPTAAAPVPRTGSPPPNGVHASSQPESPAGSVVFHDEELDAAPLPPKFLPSQGGYHDAELDAAPLPPKHLPSQAGSEGANGKLGPMEAYHARLASY